MTAPVSRPGTGSTGPSCCRTTRAVRVEGADVFGEHVVVSERSGGVLRLRVLDASGSTLRLVQPDAAGESVRAGAQRRAGHRGRSGVVREGWVRPPATVDHDLVTGAETRGPRAGRDPVARRLPVRGRARGRRRRRRGAGDADPARRTTPRRRRRRPAGPCLLYGYGAYESSLDPEFWADLLPLSRPRRDPRHRAHPWRRRARPRLVAAGTAAAQAHHVHRLRRLRPAPGGLRCHDGRPARRARHQRGRPADGRRRAPRSRATSR